MHGITSQIEATTADGYLNEAPTPHTGGVSWIVILIGSCAAVAVSLIVFAQAADFGLLSMCWLALSHALAFRAGSSWPRWLRSSHRSARRQASSACATERPVRCASAGLVPLYEYEARRPGLLGLLGHRH